MQETQVQSLGWEDPLEEEMATHYSILAWEIHGQRSLVGYSLWGLKESDTTEQLTLSLSIHCKLLKKNLKVICKQYHYIWITCYNH